MAAARFFNLDKSKNSPAGRGSFDMDSSAEIFDETPEPSPVGNLNSVRKPTSRRVVADITNLPSADPTSIRKPTPRIPSDPTDSGISDSGTKSKSVTPENYRLRSPQVIYDSEDDEETEEEEGDEDVSENGSEEDESMLVSRKKKSTIISDDEDDDVNDDEDSDDENPGSEVKTTEEDSDVDVSALVQKIKSSGAANIVSSDDSDDNAPIINAKSRSSRPRIISSDESSDETIPGSESEISGFYPSPEKNKSRLKPNPEKRNSGFKLNPEKSKADSDSDVYLTPPPPSSDEDEVSGLVNTSKDRRQQVDKPKKVVEDKDIIDVSSDSSSEDEIKEVVQPLRKAVYTDKDRNELEQQIMTLKSQIRANEFILSSRGRNLPDGGANLKETIRQDVARMGKLREVLGKAEMQRSVSSGYLPQAPSMFKTLSGSSLPSINNLPPEAQLERAKKKKVDLLNSLKYASKLHDGGQKMREKLVEVESEIMTLTKQVGADNPNKPVFGAGTTSAAASYTNQAWQDMKQNFHQMTSEEMARLYASDAAQNNLYGGRMTNNRQREVKSVTHDAMVKMHKSLESMPAEGDMEEQPKSLKSSITLFPHQLQALAWLNWREHQSAPGGILADDMGLGKTLTMISLILKHKEMEEEKEEKDSSWKTKGMGNLVKTRTTLIVCPASLMGQWENEIKNKVKSGVLRVLVYHGAGARKASAREMSRYDVIITTYGVILSEVKAELGDAFKEPKKLEAMVAADEMEVKKGKLLSLAFERIILDEAHTIRNPKSLQSQAVCKLKAARRWCVTGTPIQNKELDMYSLIRFLRCAPFDEYMVWKRWVENKSVQSTERMNTLIKSLLLRRTKDQKSNLTGKSLVNLPDKNFILHKIALTEQEKGVYSEVEKFAQGALTKFLDQKGDEEERREMGLGGGGGARYRPGGGADEFAFQPFGSKDSDDGSVKAHHLLTLLLRMRQICCHPNLIKGMLDQETREHEGIEDNGEDLDLISQLESMNLTKDREEDTTKILEMSNPVFSPDCASSKIATVVTELKKLKVKADKEGIIEKAVVISQWTAMLNIVKVHIEEQGLRYTEITGQVAISSRGEIVESFNKDKFGPQIMLLSLSAGGVGLNLVGANHLFLLDPHWNPQLESQACDRIYRVGQTREVNIHKFMVKDTVEVRILKLQENKLKLAEDMLSGAKKRGANKLTLDDLKSLFNVD